MVVKEGLIAKWIGISFVVMGVVYIPLHILAVSTDFADEITMFSYIANPGFVSVALGLALMKLSAVLRKKAIGNFNDQD